MIRTVSVLVFVLAVSSIAAWGQVEQGMIEFDTEFWFDYTDTEVRSSLGQRSSGGRWTGVISAHAGYFVTDRIDVGTSAFVSYSDADQGGNSRSFGIGPAVNRHFRVERRVVPLVGAAVLWNRSEFNSGSFRSESDGWKLRVVGGTDLFLTPNVAFRALLVSERSESNADTQTVRQDLEADSFRVEVGVAVFLGPSRSSARRPK